LSKLYICLKIAPAKLLGKVAWDLKEEGIDTLTTPRVIKKEVEKNNSLSHRLIYKLPNIVSCYNL
jgi:hypothetical protein